MKRADMMIELETFRARAKSMLDWEFDIIKETANVVDLKLRAAQPSRVVLCGLSAALLNGAVGRVVAPANSAGRVSVKLVSPAAACSRYPNGVFVMPDKMRSEPLLPQFPAISFVLHSRVKNIKGVLEQFDISVCQVAMDVVAKIGAGPGGVTARFLADEGVTENIAEHTMVCLADLSKQSVSVAATKLRLIKCLIHAQQSATHGYSERAFDDKCRYASRGFRVIDVPRPVREDVDWGDYGTRHTTR